MASENATMVASFCWMWMDYREVSVDGEEVTATELDVDKADDVGLVVVVQVVTCRGMLTQPLLSLLENKVKNDNSELDDEAVICRW